MPEWQLKSGKLCSGIFKKNFKVVHFAPESVVHFQSESVVHFALEYSVGCLKHLANTGAAIAKGSRCITNCV